MSEELGMKIGLRGEYRLVLNGGTDRESDSGWMPNLITNNGMDGLASAITDRVSYCSVGTGSSTPVGTQSSLDAFLASFYYPPVGTQTNSGSPNYTSSVTKSYAFAQGAVVGTITELGVGNAAGGTGLFSRCLIVDGTGAPTGLPVTAFDQLTVFYRLNFIPQLTDISGNVTLAGTSYAYTARICYAGTWGNNFMYLLGGSYPLPVATTGTLGSVNIANCFPAGSTLGAITSIPSGSPAYGLSSSAQAGYSAGTYYDDVTFNWGTTNGNVTGGIGCIRFSTDCLQGGYQYQFTPAIPKDNTMTMSLTFRVSWARA